LTVISAPILDYKLLEPHFVESAFLTVSRLDALQAMLRPSNI
jgi:hypothetical protein